MSNNSTIRPTAPPSTAPDVPVVEAEGTLRSPTSCHLCEHSTHGHSRAPVQTPDPEEPTTKRPVHKKNYSVDDKGYPLVYDPDDFNEEPHGLAGRIVKRMRVFAYIIFFLVPLAFVAVVFAIVPLGKPTIPTISEQWVFIFVSNSAVAVAISYLYNATFLACARIERPFRTSVIPLVTVFVAEIGVMAPVLLTHGIYDWLGIVALTVCYLALFSSMRFTYGREHELVHSFFRRFMFLLILYIPILSGFVIAYRETSSTVLQSFLSFMFAFLTFVYRRIMLSRLDPFPLEISQLLAGFWVQNLGDVTTILAFPQVARPSVFAAIFVSNSLSNVAFLVFVSNPWIYKIRPTLKTYVINAMKGNFPIPPIPEADESFDPINRGHDANTGGYRRRQFRFFFFRLLSQAISMFMYLSISPMLRFGLNKDFTALARFSADQYRNSMIYAASNMVFIAAIAVVGYVYLHKRHHQTFHEIREIHRHDLVHHTWVGLITAIITHNLILTIAIILSHYCIFSSFQGCLFV
ncbi:hypothetical protein BWQ96_02070 [Gracilariopsis chorda]|uniref:Transmembrane protein n=1 Tax=Gracilariopsis chorda TaxID=448386 RepID=A0A2V3J169_9FLOR|nr:hypothetical protein BWQ96_02070 [Gracilariopsis chorda]|eukprot:PXF48118.1 hypothetical protein BWQ96_02070 [Gracilariopsis chorda]